MVGLSAGIIEDLGEIKSAGSTGDDQRSEKVRTIHGSFIGVWTKIHFALFLATSL